MMPQHIFGWHEDRQETERIVSGLTTREFAVAAASMMDDTPRDRWLWDAEQRLFGRTLAAHDQEIGDCVSHGWGRGAQDLLFTDALSDDRSVPGLIATEAIYALSRVEIGGGRLRGDGSVGAWAADASRKYGFLIRQRYGSIDLSQYSGQRARRWGRTGLPDELEPEAREHSVTDVTPVHHIEEARVALQNRFPIPVCSGQGFETVRQRGTGICKPKGSWAHCMLTRAFLILCGGRWVFTLQQSWGESPGGPDVVQLESGQELQLPQGCFNVEAEVYERMLTRGKDSFAMAGLHGWQRPEGQAFLDNRPGGPHVA